MQAAVYSNERFMSLQQPAFRTSTLEGGPACLPAEMQCRQGINPTASRLPKLHFL